MQVVPLSVGRTARSWDEQHLDVAAAAARLGAAPTSGFTDAVAGAAARFASTWQRHVAALADRAESRADGLRSALEDYLRTDQAADQDQLALLGLLHEIR
jgi:DNA-binding transcriptional MocR family regulator